MVGYPLCATPSSWWWVGAIVDGGVAWCGGWHSDGRAAVLLTPLQYQRPLPFGIVVPFVVCPVALVEERGVCAVVPVFGLGLASCVVLCSLTSPRLSACSLSQHCWFGVVSL